MTASVKISTNKKSYFILNLNLKLTNQKTRVQRVNIYITSILVSIHDLCMHVTHKVHITFIYIHIVNKNHKFTKIKRDPVMEEEERGGRRGLGGIYRDLNRDGHTKQNLS